jgi:NADH:ubiquinone oxidoreductase subunit 5 (subunit L)/multisubunit Na+/H+ antiporter MnhA subunit
MGNIYYFMPITFTCMGIGTLALTGFPMLSGFYSKDLLLEVAYSSSSFGFFIFVIATLAAFFTSFYSIRSVYFVFFTPLSSVPKQSISKIEDAPLLMATPIIILTILSIISGYILEDIFVGPKGLLFWRHSIATPLMASLTEFEYETTFIKILPTIAALLGMFSGLYFFGKAIDYRFFLKAYSFLNLTNQKFYFDLIYNLTLAKFVVFFGYLQYKLVDRGLLELFGPTGITLVVKYLARKFAFFHNGYLFHYLLFIFSFVIILLFI